MSHFNLRNTTAYPAIFIVKQGELVMAPQLPLAPGAELDIPTSTAPCGYQVVASTEALGHTYTAAPLALSGPTHYLAQLQQQDAEDHFEVISSPATAPNQLQFEKTTLSPVYFNIERDGAPMQTVVVVNSFEQTTLQLGDTYSLFAVINGITTEAVTTDNPDAIITAVAAGNDAAGYFTLHVS